MRSSLLSGRAFRSARRGTALRCISRTQSVPVQRPIWRAVLFSIFLAGEENRVNDRSEKSQREVRSCDFFLFRIAKLSFLKCAISTFNIFKLYPLLSLLININYVINSLSFNYLFKYYHLIIILYEAEN